MRALLLLAVVLAGCQGIEAHEVGYRIAQYNYPDAGVSCWLYKHGREPEASLSCVKVAP